MSLTGRSLRISPFWWFGDRIGDRTIICVVPGYLIRDTQSILRLLVLDLPPRHHRRTGYHHLSHVQRKQLSILPLRSPTHSFRRAAGDSAAEDNPRLTSRNERWIKLYQELKPTIREDRSIIRDLRPIRKGCGQKQTIPIGAHRFFVGKILGK